MAVKIGVLHKSKKEKVKEPSRILDKFYDITDKFLTAIVIFLIGLLCGVGLGVFIMLI